MAAPSALILECPSCGEGPHRVLHGRASGRTLEAVVRCVACGQTRKATMPVPQSIDLPVILSAESTSRRSTVAVDPEDTLAVGQELYVDGERLLITSLESGGVRVRSGRAGDLSTVWTKRFDVVVVKVAVQYGGRTVPHQVKADPDEEFTAGDVMEVRRGKAVVYKIVTTEGRRVRAAPARDIKKVYARAIKERWA